jgi:hypothetical protein
VSLLSYIARWRLKNISARHQNRRFVNWEQAKTILVLAEENQLDEVSGFVTMAERENKLVIPVFIYKGKPGQVFSLPYRHIAVSTKSLSAIGLPAEDLVTAMNSKKADILIDLGSHNDIPLLALSRLSDASCKIAGFEDAAFDISIFCPKSLTISSFLEQVIVYLKMIKA